MIIYYNPACSKCREAMDFLNGENCEIEIREYLEEPPGIKELEALVQKLGCTPFDIVRKSEPLYIEKYADKKLTSAQWLKILSESPILIERPIVVDGDKALIGRPPTLVLELVKKKKK